MNNEIKILEFVLQMLNEKKYTELKVFAQTFLVLARRLYGYQFDEVVAAFFAADPEPEIPEDEKEDGQADA